MNNEAHMCSQIFDWHAIGDDAQLKLVGNIIRNMMMNDAYCVCFDWVHWIDDLIGHMLVIIDQPLSNQWKIEGIEESFELTANQSLAMNQ